MLLFEVRGPHRSQVGDSRRAKTRTQPRKTHATAKPARKPPSAPTAKLAGWLSWRRRRSSRMSAFAFCAFTHQRSRFRIDTSHSVTHVALQGPGRPHTSAHASSMVSDGSATTHSGSSRRSPRRRLLLRAAPVASSSLSSRLPPVGRKSCPSLSPCWRSGSAASLAWRRGHDTSCRSNLLPPAASCGK